MKNSRCKVQGTEISALDFFITYYLVKMKKIQDEPFALSVVADSRQIIYSPVLAMRTPRRNYHFAVLTPKHTKPKKALIPVKIISPP
jgi:hypothetical protein